MVFLWSQFCWASSVQTKWKPLLSYHLWALLNCKGKDLQWSLPLALSVFCLHSHFEVLFSIMGNLSLCVLYPFCNSACIYTYVCVHDHVKPAPLDVSLSVLLGQRCALLHPTPNCLHLLQRKSGWRYKPGLKAARWVLQFNSYDLCVSLCEEMSGSADTRCTDTVTYNEKWTCTYFFTSAGIRYTASQAGDTVTHVRPEEAVPHELTWKVDITNTLYNLSQSYCSAALGPKTQVCSINNTILLLLIKSEPPRFIIVHIRYVW